MALRLCEACSRYVRVTDPRCPFCDAELAPAHASAMTAPRMSRAAQVAFVATMFVGCRDEAKPPITPTETIDAQSPEPMVEDTGAVQQQPPPPPPPPNVKKPYGAPPVDGLLT